MNISVEVSIQPGPEVGVEIHAEGSAISTWIPLSDLEDGIPEWLWEEDDLFEVDQPTREVVNATILEVAAEARDLQLELDSEVQ